MACRARRLPMNVASSISDSFVLYGIMDNKFRFYSHPMDWLEPMGWSLGAREKRLCFVSLLSISFCPTTHLKNLSIFGVDGPHSGIISPRWRTCTTLCLLFGIIRLDEVQMKTFRFVGRALHPRYILVPLLSNDKIQRIFSRNPFNSFVAHIIEIWFQWQQISFYFLPSPAVIKYLRTPEWLCVPSCCWWNCVISSHISVRYRNQFLPEKVRPFRPSIKIILHVRKTLKCHFGIRCEYYYALVTAISTCPSGKRYLLQ